MASKKTKKKRTGGKRFVPQGRPFVSEAMRFRLRDLENDFVRADLQLHGLEHGGASYEGRVFLNNPDADATTPLTDATGYAGSFHVFGHGTCYGDVGHCEAHAARRTRDLRAGHPLTPAFKRLPITDALRRAAGRRSSITVTIVPIVRGGDGGCNLDEVLTFDRLKIVTYD